MNMLISCNQSQLLSFDSMLDAIVAIAIFILGIIASNLSNYLSEKRRIKNVKNFLKFALSSIVISAKQQIENLVITSSEIGNSKHYHFMLRDNVNLNNKSLSSISALDLHRIIFKLRTKNNHSEILDTILNTIDLITTHRKNYITNFHLFFTKYSDYEKRWNENFESLTKMVEEETVNKDSFSKSKLNNSLNDVFSYYRKNVSDNDMITKKELFIDKIIEAYKASATDINTENIYISALVCSNIFQYILEHRKIYSAHMLNEKETLEKRIIILEKIIALL